MAGNPGNQPGLYAALDALDSENTPVAAATSEISHGRVETRTIRVLPAPDVTNFGEKSPAILIERSVRPVKENGHWVMRNCEAVLYVADALAAGDTTPEDLLAHVRSHWQVEHTHWLRNVVWNKDESAHPHRKYRPGTGCPPSPTSSSPCSAYTE